MDFFLANIIHVANVLYLVSYSVRDILWLRILTVTAALCLIPYFYFQAEPLWAAIAWNSLFIVINVIQSAILFNERRPIKLSGDELKLYQLAFRTLTPREFKKLMNTGDWKTAKTSENLIKEGEQIDRMMVVFDGLLGICKNEKEVAQLRPGCFVGEMSYLTGNITSAGVFVKEDTRYVSWSFDKLQDTLSKNPQLRSAFQMIIGSDLVAKLRMAW